jgi:hypothetical protein
MSQQAHPTRQALQAFLYTRTPALVVDVVPVAASISKYFEVGNLLSYSSSANYSAGYWQGDGEALVMQCDLTDVDQNTVAGQNFLGVCVGEEPLNRPAMDDLKGKFEVQDRGINVTTMVGPMMRVAAVLTPCIVLMEFCNASGADAALTNADINKPCWVSITNGGTTGRAGSATVTTADSPAVEIGTVWGVPISGGTYAYVLFDPSKGRGT